MRYMFSLPAGHLPATLHLPPSIAAFTAACCRGIRGLVKLDALQASPESFFSCFACPERRLRHCDVHGRFRHCLGSRGGGLAQRAVDASLALTLLSSELVPKLDSDPQRPPLASSASDMSGLSSASAPSGGLARALMRASVRAASSLSPSRPRPKKQS